MCTFCYTYSELQCTRHTLQSDELMIFANFSLSSTAKMAMQDLLKADDIKKALDTFKGFYIAYLYKRSVLTEIMLRLIRVVRL